MSAYAQRPRLNHDLLLDLFNYVAPRRADVAALMSTCKTLRHAGVRTLLADGVVIQKPAELRSFCAFMLSDLPSRASFLRQFSIKIPREDMYHYPDSEDESLLDIAVPQDKVSGDNRLGYIVGVPWPEQVYDACLTTELVNMLAQVLEQAKNLEDLSVENCDGLLGLDDESFFAAAIVNHEHLRRFHVADSDVGDYLTLDVLRLMKSPLKTLYLDCSAPIGRETSIIELAVPFVSTLEKLVVDLGKLVWRDWQVMNIWHLTSLNTESGLNVKFPRVHTLGLRDIEDIEELVLLFETFPSVRQFQLLIGENMDAEAMREEAQFAMTYYTWGVLDRLCGDVDSLYGLGSALRTKILEVYRVSCEMPILEWLRTVISETQPSRLILHIGVEPGFIASDLTMLIPPGIKLTHLYLEIVASALWGSKERFVSTLATLLCDHPLEFLILRLEKLEPDAFDPEQEDFGGWWHRPKQNKMVEGFKTSSFEDVLRRLFKAAPTLAHVVLEIEGHRYSHWTLRGGDDGLVIQVLDESASVALVRAQGLEFTEGLFNARCY
ncbi:hypothetical protein C2E23DRAFT_860659 [Lenzites betulinus]|nr:hypothetical protein C2E23DRAFT_860659 [Lenzites betulinus]